MLNKTSVKAVGTVTVGVILAGLIMNQFRNIGIFNQASAGFDV